MKSIIVMMMGLLMVSPVALADGEGLRISASREASRLLTQSLQEALELDATPATQKGLSVRNLQHTYGRLLKNGRDFLMSLPDDAKSFKNEVRKELGDRLRSLKELKNSKISQVGVKVVGGKTKAAVTLGALVAAGGASASTDEQPLANQAFDSIANIGLFGFTVDDLTNNINEHTGVDLNTQYRVTIDRQSIAAARDLAFATLSGGGSTQYDPNATSAAAQR